MLVGQDEVAGEVHTGGRLQLGGRVVTEQFDRPASHVARGLLSQVEESCDRYQCGEHLGEGQGVGHLLSELNRTVRFGLGGPQLVEEEQLVGMATSEQGLVAGLDSIGVLQHGGEVFGGLPTSTRGGRLPCRPHAVFQQLVDVTCTGRVMNDP